MVWKMKIKHKMREQTGARGGTTFGKESCLFAVILYVSRFIRILPTYMFFLFIYAYVYPYAGDGPEWFLVGKHADACHKTWWTNMVFINNFYPTATDTVMEPCMEWSWYLANDMQFFWCTPPLLFLYVWKPTLGLITTILALVASTVANIYVTVHFHLDSMGLSPQTAYIEQLYVKPYCRAQSYLVGVLFAYFIHWWVVEPVSDVTVAMEHPICCRRGAHRPQKGAPLTHRPAKLPVWAVFIIFIIAVTLVGVVTFGEKGDYTSLTPPWNKHDPSWQNIFFLGFTKIAFTLGVSMLAFLCMSGNGGLLNWFLTWDIWNLFARLTFGAYLVHPMLISMVYSTTRESFAYDRFFIVSHCVAFLFGAYLLATVQYLILEKPVMRIMKTLMQPPKKRKKPTSDHTEIDSKQQDPEEARTEERDHTIKDSS